MNLKLISHQSKNTFENKEGNKIAYTNYFIVCDNGKAIQIKCAFKDDYKLLSLMADTDVDLDLVKKQSKDTYKNKLGKDCHYYNYFISNGNNKWLQIKCAYSKDYDRIDMIACYIGADNE